MLALVIICVLSAVAQRSSTPSSPLPAADSSTRAAREDTTYALQRLYQENRRRYRIYAGLSGGGLGFTGTRAILTYFAQPGFTEAKLSTGIVIVGFAVFFTRSALLLYSFRAGREKRLIAAMQRGVPLPHKVRIKLKSSYFDAQTSSE